MPPAVLDFKQRLPAGRASKNQQHMKQWGSLTPVCNTMSKQLPPAVETTLSGWGRYPVSKVQVSRPEALRQLDDLVRAANGVSLLPRGAGRSYGDASLNSRGRIILSERLNRMLSFDDKAGVLRCEAGVSLAEILDVFIPRGWFVAVTPGTKFTTVGGAVACDVHGKNHHRDGSFGHCVRSIRLVTAAGETVECSRQERPELFDATLGGMGLTGFIIEVEFSLLPIETAYVDLLRIKSKNLEETMALFDQHEPGYQYTVAWLDCMAPANALGRSVLFFGNHARLGDLPARLRERPLDVSLPSPIAVPFDAPSGLLNKFTMTTLNSLYYMHYMSWHNRLITPYTTFFYPLDRIGSWNRLYGSAGFVQYQCVLPPENSRQGIRAILSLSKQRGLGSFLAVLKRLGPQTGLLSFPMPGYTLTLDFAVKPGVIEFLAELDKLVIEYGDRVYLAKDTCLSAEAFRIMYPQFGKWLAIKNTIDPDWHFSSDMAERLKWRQQ